MRSIDRATLLGSAKAVGKALPFPIVEPLVFPRESLWLRTQLRPKASGDRSVILFTMHKVASTFTRTLMSELNDNILGLRRMDWDRYIHSRFPVDTTSWLAEHEGEIFAQRGFVYGPFRAPLPIANLEEYRAILLLRDPRDLVTSAYFSEAYSHPIPTNKHRVQEFEERRARVQATRIDEYVLARADEITAQYEAYRVFAESAKLTPLTYEQMILDFDGFLDGLESRLEVVIDPTLRDRLRALGRIGEDLGDDRRAHMRKGLPGDHTDKLLPDTIASLDSTFGDVLTWLQAK